MNKTGNPVGSKAFLDFEDNVRILDQRLTSDQDTFQDRLGKSRLTWAGIEKAGTGDPAIAVDAAARAEAAASQVQQDAVQIAQDAAQQAVQGVVAGVDGQVAVAEEAADRAEAAAVAALASGNLYDTPSQGVAATTDGQYFFVKTSDPQVFNIFLNSSGTAQAAGQFRAVGTVRRGDLTSAFMNNGLAPGDDLKLALDDGTYYGVIGSYTDAPTEGTNPGWGFYMDVRDVYGDRSRVVQRIFRTVGSTVEWVRAVTGAGASATDWQFRDSSGGGTDIPDSSIDRSKLISGFRSIDPEALASNSLDDIDFDCAFMGQAQDFTGTPASGLAPASYFLFDATAHRADGEFTVQRLYRYPNLDRWWVRTVIAGQTAPAWIRKDILGADTVNADSIIDGVVSRGKLTPQFAFNGTLDSGTLNAPLAAGVYLVTNAVEGRPPGMNNQLGIFETWGDGSFRVDRITTRNSPKERWVRDCRAGTGVYNGWVYDGLERGDFDRIAGKRIVCMGDSITASYGLPDNIAANLAAEVVNLGIGGTRMGAHSTTGFDQLSAFQIATAIGSGDWSSVLSGATYLAGLEGQGYQYILDRMTLASNLDWETVDYIILGYGTNDFGGGNDIGSPDDATGATYLGGLNLTIEGILSAYPHIRLLFWSPIWRRRTPTDTGGVAGGSDVSPNGNGEYLYDFVGALVSRCRSKHVEAVDLYHSSGIYETTYLHYLIDELHPTPAGSKLIADKICGALTSRW